MKKTVLAFLFSLLASAALAQSSPNLQYGQVPTAAQWNSYFAAKQDVLGYTPVNKAGDTMQGKLTLFASTTGTAGLNCGTGSTPSSPVNGDVWCTSSGIFVRINGSTIGPLSNGSGAPTGAAGGDLTGSYPDPTIATNAVTNAKAAQMAAVTLKGNPTNALANASDFTIASLTALGSPDATNDYLLIWDHTAGVFKKINPGTIAASATAGVSSIAGATGAISIDSSLTMATTTLGVATNGITNALFRQGGALSVVGRSANSTGNVADIAAAQDGQVLVRTGTSLGFGAIDLSSPNSVVNVLPNANLDIGSTADFLSGASGAILTADTVFADEVTLTYNATQVMNFNNFQNAVITMTGNITSFSCSNQKANQGGVIRFKQDGTGSRTLPATFGCNMKFLNSTQPTASTTANAIDALFYYCVTSSYCLGNYQKNYAP